MLNLSTFSQQESVSIIATWFGTKNQINLVGYTDFSWKHVKRLPNFIRYFSYKYPHYYLQVSKLMLIPAIFYVSTFWQLSCIKMDHSNHKEPVECKLDSSTAENLQKSWLQ